MFSDALKNGEFVITCEFVPGRGKEGRAIDASVQLAKELVVKNPRVHSVSLCDGPGGNPAILPDILAKEIQDTGAEALIHFSCRDLNRNAIEARVMAMARNGINNIFIVSGDYTQSGYEGQAAGVFDLDSVQTVRYLKAMNAGLVVPGRKKATTTTLAHTDFFIGVTVSPFKLLEEEYIPQLLKLDKKVTAGADFIIPQLGYDMRKFFEIKRYLVSRGITIPILGNVYAPTVGIAKVMRAGLVPGCIVPDELVRMLEEESRAPDKGKAKRLERAAKMVAMFKGMGFNGVHIGGFGLMPGDFRYIVDEGERLASRWEEFIPEVSFGRAREYYAFPLSPSYRIKEADDEPVINLRPTRTSVVYVIMLAMHRLVFAEHSIGFKVMRAYYRRLGTKSVLAKFTHLCELILKIPLFRCRDCGDCCLVDTAYYCPQAGCPKQQRNGPCGGSIDGMCEVYPDEKRCVWTKIYTRLKNTGKLEQLRRNYMPPRKMELDHTSAWSNYFLGRDHIGHT